MPTESVHATTMSARQQSTSAKHRAILKQPRNQLIFAANQTKLTHLMASHAIQLLPSTFTNMSAAFTPASTMVSCILPDGLHASLLLDVQLVEKVCKIELISTFQATLLATHCKA
jgi:hypothetical protein